MARILDRVMVERWLRDEVVQKVPQGGPGDIRLGSQCIVNPGEVALFVRGGESLGTLNQGRHTLTTENLPLLDRLVKGIFSGKNVFTADVFFVKTTDITMKWGTANPIVIEHVGRGPGASAMVGNGTYVMKVTDPWRFLTAMDAFRDSVRAPHLKDRLDPMLGVMMQDKLSELAEAKNLGPAQLQSFSKDLNDMLIGLLQAEFDAIGLSLVDFNIRIALHPNSLEVVTKMGYGTSYSQMQQADALRAAADSGGSDGLAGLGIGAMGMGALQQQQMMQQQQQQILNQQAAASASSAAPAPESAAAPAASDGGMPDVMTPEQAAGIIQVTEADIIAAIEAGDLKARKIGAAYRISKANLEAFLNG
ncbi:MAG: excisionase family DNA binding protein [Cellvibrionaceae bacterium]|jgi:excisionase family DNA binding protein